MEKIKDNRLDIDFYDYFMDEKDNRELFNILEDLFNQYNKTFQIEGQV